MSHSNHNEDAIFKAVADAADDLDLELEASGDLDHRMVGVFAAPLAHSGTAPADLEGLGTVASVDNDEILKALEGWATTHPEDAVETHGQFTTDPYVTVMEGGVKTITREYLEQWQNSDDLERMLSRWRPKRSREATLSNVQIVYVSDGVANATFQTRELGEGDVPVIANGSAMLVKDASGVGTAWKVAAVSKFGDFE